MNFKNVVVFLPLILLLLYSSFSLNTVSVHASTANGTLLQIDNQSKVGYPNELVQFSITVVNNVNRREDFIIRYVGENSVLWLPMDITMGDDDQKVYDSSSFGNHGTIHGATWANLETGKWALSFGSENDYVDCGNPNSLRITNAITLEAWIKADDVTGSRAIIGKWWSGPIEGSYLLIIEGGMYKMYIIDGEAVHGAGGGTPEVGVWHHVVGTFDGFVIKIYVDGSEVGSTDYAGAIKDTDYKVGIGSFYGDAWRHGFDGTIDEVRIYNRALTADEIRWLYNGSWRENLSSYNVELGPSETTQMTFSVKVPQDAKASHIYKFLLTTFPRSNPRYRETETVTVEVLEHHDVEVSLDENEKSGKPRDIINFDATVMNLGNVEDTYDISVEDDGGWNISFSPESIAIPSGGASTGTVTISVAVPSEAYPGDSTSFRVQAASRGDPNLVAQVEGTAAATAYDFNITAHPELGQGSSGSEVTFSLELKNLGTVPDTFDLEIENAMDWDIEVDLVRNDGSTIHDVDFPNSISLENGKTGKVAVRVRIPEDALIGQTKGITIQAVSRGDPRVSAESSISVVVVTPFWERPDGGFLIGLSIGTLVCATLIGSIILRRAQIIRRRSRKS